MKIKYGLIFVLTILIMSIQPMVFAEDGWSYDNGTLTVWKDTVDYQSNSKRPWEDYTNYINKLVIKDEVTSIGDWGFSNLKNLKTVEFSQNLKIIGERAFYNCESLTYINLPEGLKTIENGAFNSCKGVVRISLPESLEKIGDSAFMNLPKVTVLTVPESVEHIGMWAFMGCTSLEQLYFEGDVPEYIGNFCIVDIHEYYTFYYSAHHRDSWLEFDKVAEEKLMAYYPEERIPVYINNSEICFDVDPVIVEGRTLVPMRDVFEALGAKVDWNGEYATATATKGNTTVSVQIDSDTMRKNNQIISLDVSAMLYLNRTFVPVRAVSEAFDAKVSWNNEERAVYIEIE